MLKRILMNAADPDTTGSGGGAAVQSAPPAAPASAAPVTVEAMLEAVKDPAMRDAFFSAGRKQGLFRDRPAKPTGEPTTTPPAQSATEPSVAEIVQAEISRSRAFDRALLFSGVELTPAQVTRIERAYASEKPQHAAEWVSDFIADMGLGKKVAAATTVTTPVQPTTPAPAPAPVAPSQSITSRGAPSATTENPDAIDFKTLSASDRDALIRRIGNVEFNKRVNDYLRGVTIRR